MTRSFLIGCIIASIACLLILNWMGDPEPGLPHCTPGHSVYEECRP